MKTSYIFCSTFVAVAGFSAMAPPAHAQSVIFTSFDETIIIGTDTFESAQGTPLFSTSAVAWSDFLSPTIEANIEADTSLPAPVLSSAPAVFETTDYQFLTAQGPAYVVPSGAATATPYPITSDMLGLTLYFISQGGAGYSLVSETPTTVGNYSDTIYGLDSAGDEAVGTVNVNEYDLNFVEQANGAVPEPSPLALLGLGLVPLVIRTRRRLSRS